MTQKPWRVYKASLEAASRGVSSARRESLRARRVRLCRSTTCLCKSAQWRSVSVSLIPNLQVLTKEHVLEDFSTFHVTICPIHIFACAPTLTDSLSAMGCGPSSLVGPSEAEIIAKYRETVRSCIGPETDATVKDRVTALPDGLDLEVEKNLGFFSNHGYEKKRFSSTVVAKTNQDRVFVTPKFNGAKGAWVLACYDGNGPQGHLVAEAAGHEVVGLLEKSFKTENVDAAMGDAKIAMQKKCLSEAFTTANTLILQRPFSAYSGSTATVLLLQGATLLCANVGDSKCVRVVEEEGGKWGPRALTASHRPSDKEERARIEAAGGFVLHEEEYGAARVFNHPDPIGQMVEQQMRGMSSSGGAGMMDASAGAIGAAVGTMTTKPWPGLAVSRCFGHHGVLRVGITSEPSVTQVNLTSSDRCIIIASDGIWDFFEEAEAVDLVKSHAPDGFAASKALIEAAQKKWLEDDPNYCDDISACVFFHQTPSAFPGGKVEAAVKQEAAKPAAAKTDGDGKKKVTATRDQRRRSVVTGFTQKI